jgi:hypothetical protein
VGLVGSPLQQAAAKAEARLKQVLAEQDQADALRTIVETVAGLADDLNITHWELFTLRDADSRGDDVFGRFGILRDDYTRKPAYDVLRRAIAGTAGGR